MKFTASQSRHWLENSIPLLEGVFRRNGITAYKTDKAWISWKALVAFTTAGTVLSMCIYHYAYLYVCLYLYFIYLLLVTRSLWTWA